MYSASAIGAGTGKPSSLKPSMWKRIASRIVYLDGLHAIAGRDVAGEIRYVGRIVAFSFLNDDGLPHQRCSFRPACLRILAQVPGARSSDGICNRHTTALRRILELSVAATRRDKVPAIVFY